MPNKTPLNDKKQRHGHWEVYHDNGKLIYKGLFINGKAFGKHVSYHDDGSLYFMDNFINSQVCGYVEVHWSDVTINKEYYAR